ncbi:MAG: anaerobic ribonucleoside-triphosphate reductase activating protein [Rhodoferax sp.]
MRPPTAGPAGLRVGGLTRLTSIDFPGRLAAVVFCQGCPWRCTYCHNPDLLDAGAATSGSWAQVLAFLQTRRGLLDGVVFSGGEPTLQAALVPALAAVRGLGFETALHTGGMYPERLATALPLLDWVGLDIKAPLHRHDALTGTPNSGPRTREALRILLASGVPYECRTTWHSGLFGADELLALADELAALGVTHWALQACQTPSGAPFTLSSEQMAYLTGQFAYFVVRRA